MQRFMRLLLIFFIVFIVYNTLIPFKIIHDSEQLHFNIQNIQWLQFDKRLSLTDIFGNVLLFIPLGFLIGLNIKKMRPIFRIVLAVIFGFLLSLAIEITQLFFLERTTSVIDLFNNTLGSAIGIVCAVFFSSYLEEPLFLMIRKLAHSQPLALIIAAIVITHSFASIVPFNVTITVSELKKTFKQANIGLLSYKPLGEYFNASLKKAEYHQFVWQDFIEDTIYFSILGYLIALCYFRYWRQYARSFVLSASAALLFFPAIEFIQLFIRSRVFDINDIFAGYLGVLFGVGVLYMSYHNNPRILEKPETGIKTIIPVGLYFLYLIYAGFNPFNFTLDASVISRDFQPQNLIPFFSYFKKTTIWNIYDMGETALAFVPVAFILHYIWSPQSSSGKQTLQAITISALLGLTIEAGQLFLPNRIGEITDVILYALGGYAGILICRWYVATMENQSSETDV